MQIDVLEYFDRTVSRTPAKVALVDETVSWSFEEVGLRVQTIATSVRSHVRGTNQPVAVYLPKSARAVIACWAALSSGNFYVPLDTKSPLTRTLQILENLKPALILSDEAGKKALASAGVPDDAILVPAEETHRGPLMPLAPRDRIDTDPAYIIYTSGSTGTPKGVVVSHRGVIDYIDWARATFTYDESDVIGNQAPLFFDNSTLDLYLCLATGATLVMIPEALFMFPVRLVEYLKAASVSAIFWVPSAMMQVANTDALAVASDLALAKVLFAGEVMPATTLRYWRSHMPGALFANLYGPTEITVDCTYYIVDRDFGDGEAVPIGIPCRNSGIVILNEDDQAAADGEVGELCVRGSSLAHGYWNDEEKTARAFVRNPLNPHYPETIYRTGDLVYRNERGYIMFVGRRDSQVKHHGYRIELGEIENACDGISGMRSACVLYDRPRQEICLFYEGNSELDRAEIRRHLLERLPRYMLPAFFHRLERMPMNANSKIDRPAVQKMLEGLRNDAQ